MFTRHFWRGRWNPYHLYRAAIQVWDEYTGLAPNGAPSYMENVLRDDFEYNDEFGYTVAVMNGTPIPSTTPTASRPYRSVTEHMTTLAESEP